jgi:hypothetical protein
MRPDSAALYGLADILIDTAEDLRRYADALLRDELERSVHLDELKRSVQPPVTEWKPTPEEEA